MTSDKMSIARRLAAAVSWVGHPLVFISLAMLVVVALRVANRAGLAVLLTLLVCVVIPMALLLFRNAIVFIRAPFRSRPSVSLRFG